jgi:uncharacterized membrane protein (DUF4010 family)
MVSIVRVLIIVTFVAPQLVSTIAVPALIAAAVIGLGGALAIASERKGERAEVNVSNPFDLGPLLLFAAAYAAIALVNNVLAPAGGALLLTSGISGLFDVDVAVLTAARLAPSAADIASQAILLALGMNAIARAAIAVSAGPFLFFAVYVPATFAAVLAGLAAWFLTR